MLQINSLAATAKIEKDCVWALGTFDGLHLGHCDVITTAKKEARRLGAQLAVFTFSNHPLSVLTPHNVPASIINSEEKHRILAKMGTDVLLEVPFDRELLQLAAEDFLQRLARLRLRVLVVGANFTYGKDGAGSSAALLAIERPYRVIVRPLLSIDGEVVSSSAIRRQIASGEVRQAARMLGRAYSLAGKVVHGEERGRLLGYPTANLELGSSTLVIPASGVYAVRVYLDDGRSFNAMANVGVNPTFGELAQLRLETHLFNFSGDLYGQNLRVAFFERLRSEKKFTKVTELVAQLERDKEICQKILLMNAKDVII